METHIEYDPEYAQEADSKREKASVARSASERVLEWRKKHPEKYKAYQREYMRKYRKKLVKSVDAKAK